MSKKPPFKDLESYKHKAAKKVLRKWFKSDYQVELERKFYIDGRIVFVPDVTLSDNNIIQCVYEVTHTHGLTGKKLGMIQSWCYRNRLDFPVYEIDAEYILRQCGKPKVIKADKFVTKTF